jgi:AraC family transcriptional regulator of adaptative response / DNA-3-methyladenine glycosylase II
VVHRYGEALPTPVAPGLECLFPRPEVLVEADLNALGITTARAQTIRGVARALLDGRVDFRVEQSLDEFVQRWVALPGIGEWTAHYMAMRGLSHPDAFPAADLILRRAASTDGTMLSTKALTQMAEAWRPWRAYAVMHLWRSVSEPAKQPAASKKRAVA